MKRNIFKLLSISERKTTPRNKEDFKMTPNNWKKAKNNPETTRKYSNQLPVDGRKPRPQEEPHRPENKCSLDLNSNLSVSRKIETLPLHSRRFAGIGGKSFSPQRHLFKHSLPFLPKHSRTGPKPVIGSYKCVFFSKQHRVERLKYVN